MPYLKRLANNDYLNLTCHQIPITSVKIKIQNLDY
jgi:hypothetical protein